MTPFASRRDILKFALFAPALAAAGAPPALADGLTLIDFANRLVAPDEIKATGYDGALVYVSELQVEADVGSSTVASWRFHTLVGNGPLPSSAIVVLSARVSS